MASPIRVPPDQSSTDLMTPSMAESTFFFRSSRVIRVSRVLNTKTSTVSRPCSRAWTNWSSSLE
jgi:hypothetical protein